MKTKIIFLYLVFNSFAFSFGQKNISCGLGVVFLNSPNIVDYVSTYGNKINEFENFPEFKIAIAIPIEDNLNLNGEFSYLFSTFNSENIYPISHEIKFFLPTIMLQKVFEEQFYNVKLGVGLGYHFTEIVEKSLGNNPKYNSDGFGIKGETSLDIQLDENFYSEISTSFRANFFNKFSQKKFSPNFISVGILLGFKFYL